MDENKKLSFTKNEKLGYGFLCLIFIIGGIYTMISGEIGQVATNSIMVKGLLARALGFLMMSAGCFLLYVTVRN